MTNIETKSKLIDINSYPISRLLDILLKDKSSKRNIIWATDAYASFGDDYKDKAQMYSDLFIKANSPIIKPRIEKDLQEQHDRTKKKAEVFTPAWLCNQMNNYLDEDWFGRKNVFNKEIKNNWKANNRKITFSKKLNKTWKEYVADVRLEITCGEAPFLVSRYDTSNGELIMPLNKRIGLLDRKLRIVSENTETEEEWLVWAKKAYESVYGYEYQGDSLLIARINLLLTFIDYYKDKFNKEPDLKTLKSICTIIVWNIWQMDGLTDTVPLGKPFAEQEQLGLNLFEEENEEETTPCIIKDWRCQKTIIFNKCKEDKKMSKKLFDYVIGNPPYQLSKEKTKTQTQGNSDWIYYYFQMCSDKIARNSCLIYPFGGWFDSPREFGGFGEKILTDKHTKIIRAYEGSTDKRTWYRTDKIPNPIFGANVNLSAGVSIVYRNENINDSFKYSNRVYNDKIVDIKFNEIDFLAPNPVFYKINEKLGENKLNLKIKKGIFGIESNFAEENPDKVSFNKSLFENPIHLLVNDKSGSTGRATWFWTDRKIFKKGVEFLDCYKVITTSAYPKQKFTSGNPTVENVKQRLESLIELLEPNTAFGASRLLLYSSSSKDECLNYIKYTKTTFFAGLTLQEPNRRSSFGFIIPLQNFSSNSDIDWSKSIHEIDLQLYKKYGLDDKEIEFIESHVKEME